MLIGVSFMSGEAVPVYPGGAPSARLLSGAAGPAWDPSAGAAGGEMLPAWGHRAGPTVAVRRKEEPRCEWQTDGWAFVGMVFIAWAMLWGLGVLNQVRYRAAL